jgi:hypothetical protein
MGTFAEPAIIDYYLSFADQEKQTSVFCFRFQQTNGSLPFLFSVYIKKRKLPFFRLQAQLKNTGRCYIGAFKSHFEVLWVAVNKSLLPKNTST